MQFTSTKVAKDMDALQDALGDFASGGKRVALVPTMGALHEGHMTLIQQAKQLADAVVVSIFVNPAQFGPNEDFSKYPRSLDNDVKKAVEAGASLIYAPPVEDLYPEGFSTSISVGELSKILEGKSRPGHFDGVATVVTKLLLRILPHVTVFGEKDYQQLCVIRRMVSDLDLGLDIVAAPTHREKDGLAMSSRNVYLSPEERKIAPKLYETLKTIGQAIASGSLQPKAALDQGITSLNKAGFKVDYLELRDAGTLDTMNAFSVPARLLVAAQLGTTRLIDNIALE